ncbi:PGAP1-domain-containing protein [Neoconidiobolus thromboides FSU 785]|nr:PGAP1-domain-containing protein [Neoconidiobolus thromboides FSU 785]
MTYSYPEFIKQHFASNTKELNRYSLYLYKDLEFDNEKELYGTPVLFLPGNAGSYKQVRSIAKTVSLLAKKRNIMGLDFFTINFNEELSALVGQILVDQSNYAIESIDYILKLYQENLSNNKLISIPTSVIVIGHSMGGIVARNIPSLKVYKKGSINSIFTLASPHLYPRLPLEKEMYLLYDQVNHFWRERNFHQNEFSDIRNELNNISLISITGGNRDSQIASDLSELSTLVNKNHGFTVYTTSLPKAWVSSDHQSILWCKQVVLSVSKAILNIIDINSEFRTLPIKNRMQQLKLDLLQIPKEEADFELKMEEAIEFKEDDKELELDLNSSELLKISSNIENFNFISSKEIVVFKCLKKDNKLLICNNFDTITSTLLPATEHQFDKGFGDVVLQHIHVNLKLEDKFDYLLIRGKEKKIQKVKIKIQKEEKLIIQPSIMELLLGYNTNLVNKKQQLNTYFKIQLKLPESPLLAYKFMLKSDNNPELNFILRQINYQINEYKYFVNKMNEAIKINFHSQAKMPNHHYHFNEINNHIRDIIQDNVNYIHNPHELLDPFWKFIELHLWLNLPHKAEINEKEMNINLHFQLDVYSTLGRLFKRIDLAIAVFPFSLIILLFTNNLLKFKKIHYIQYINCSLKKELIYYTIILWIFSIIQSIIIIFQWDDLISNNHWDLFPDFSLLLINDRGLLCTWIIPLITLMSAGFIIIYYFIVIGLIIVFQLVSTIIKSKSWLRLPYKQFLHFPLSLRFLSLFLLTILTAKFIPNFILYTIIVLIAINNAKISKMNFKIEQYQLDISIVHFLFTALPSHVPALIVWFRSFIQENRTLPILNYHPLSFDNILLTILILCFIINPLSATLIENLQKRKLVCKLVYILFTTLAIYTALTGFTYTFIFPQIATYMLLICYILDFGIAKQV